MPASSLAEPYVAGSRPPEGHHRQQGVAGGVAANRHFHSSAAPTPVSRSAPCCSGRKWQTCLSFRKYARGHAGKRARRHTQWRASAPGHASITMTLDRYGKHMALGTDEAAAEVTQFSPALSLLLLDSPICRLYVMRMRGLEPPRPYGHTDLNRARLPIPPHPRARDDYSAALSRGSPRGDLADGSQRRSTSSRVV